MRLASRLLRIQSGEGQLVALVMGLMFVATAAITIGESGIEALFFDRVGVQALPLMYLLQGGATFVAMLALTSALGRLGPRRAYLAAPLVLGGLVLAERVLLVGDFRWMYRLLWITVALGTLLHAIFLWGTAGAVVDTRQARRLFPIFGAGGILGSVIGGLATRPLAAAVGTANLLLVWAGGLGGAFLLARLVLGPAAQARRRPPRRDVTSLDAMTSEFAFVRRSRLLVRMAVAAVLFSIIFYLLYLPYARAATERFQDAEELAGFFGLFWAAGTATAFVVSMLVTNRLFGWFGIAAMVIVLPFVYTTAFGLLLVASGFTILVALRFVSGVWLQGVAQPGWEALTNVVPDSRRDQTRAFLNGGPAQIGTMIAGVLALVGQGLSLSWFAVIGMVAAVLTIVVTIGIRRSYTSALVEALHTGRPQVFEGCATRWPSVQLGADADSVRVLVAALRSGDVRVRRLAYQLVVDLPIKTRPPELAAGVDDVDPIVRRTAVRALDASTPEGRAALLSTIEDTNSAVAAAAAAHALNLTDDARPAARLRRLLTDPDERIRRTTVEQLALAPADRAVELGSAALTDPAPEVRAAALEQLAHAAPDRSRGPAIASLGDPDGAVRVAAGRALGCAHEPRVDDVLVALGDRRTADAGIEAVRCLQLDGDTGRVHAFVRSAAARAARDREVAAAIAPREDAAGLLHDAILDRGRRVAVAALWAATMLDERRSEMATAIENLDGEPGQLATALEALDTTGDPRLLRPLLALWEPAPPSTSKHDWLSIALHDEDEFIRRCAELVRMRRQGDTMKESPKALSILERVLSLREVPLLAGLAPADLERVAELADECGYADGEVIAAEGELGEDLHIVVEGTIRVVQDRDGSGRELARRTAPDVVGEMSIITREPRVASLMADTAVRTIRLGHRAFISILRERPDVALAVMRVLAQRLSERDHNPIPERASVEEAPVLSR